MRNRVRECMEKEIAPIMTEACFSFLLIVLKEAEIGQNSAEIPFVWITVLNVLLGGKLFFF